MCEKNLYLLLNKFKTRGVYTHELLWRFRTPLYGSLENNLKLKIDDTHRQTSIELLIDKLYETWRKIL